MKRLVILGAGTAGTMMANHLHRELDEKIWEIDVVDESVNHYYHHQTRQAIHSERREPDQ
jgi:sulfide:quinone oxidoreductase